MLAALFLTLLVVGCRNATKTVEEADAAAELGRDGKCWHLVRLHGANTMDTEFCLAVLAEALEGYGIP